MAFLDQLNQLTEWLLLTSLKSLPLIALILLLQFLLKKQLPATARFSLWLSLFIGLSFPIGWNFEFHQPINKAQITTESLENQSTQPAVQQVSGESNNFLSEEKIDYFANENYAENITKFDFHTIFSFLWLIILIVILISTAWKMRYLINLANKSKLANPMQLQILENVKSTLDYDKNIILLFSDDVKSPFTFGLITKRIIFPLNIHSQLTNQQIQHVLLHEVAHIKRQDILWNWIGYWLCVIHWFNPALWFAMYQMKCDMEVACDATVLKHLQPTDYSHYGLTLIDVSQLFLKKPKMISLGILDNHRDLKNRITMIKEFSVMNNKKSFLFALIFSALTFTALAQPAKENDSQPQLNAQQNNDNMLSLLDFAKRAEQDLNMPVLVGQQFATTRIPTNLTNSKLNYGQVLTQLKINGFTAYKNKDYIQIISVIDARSFAIPIVEKNKVYFEDEYVTDYIKIEKACAGSLLATLRPLSPREAHVTVLESANTIVISDFYQNIQRIKVTIQTLEDNIKTPGCPSPK